MTSQETIHSMYCLPACLCRSFVKTHLLDLGLQEALKQERFKNAIYKKQVAR